MKKLDCILGGYSLRGTYHSLAGLPKQDYVITKQRNGLVVCVVADGLGSHKNSAVGSKCVCEAVLQTAELFRRGIAGREKLFVQMIRNMWSCMIYPFSPGECGSTCLLAVRFLDGNVFVAQVGDGVIAYEIENRVEVLSRKEDDFFNITESIHSADLSEWKWRVIPAAGKPFRLYMHTDGINVLPDMTDRFLCELYSVIASKNKEQSVSECIREILLGLDRDIADDDMTLACMAVN